MIGLATLTQLPLLSQANTGGYVLRKKPPPPTLPSAHAVEREYRVIAALGPTPVPVPAAIALCEDPTVLGTPFYLMTHVRGRIFDDPSLPELPPAARAAVYAAMARTLAALHSVKPADVGLGDYGPAAGYNARQVRRWARQYAASVAPGEAAISEMVALGGKLVGRIPAGDGDAEATRVSHGDFRLDNLVYDSTTDGTVLAVLDWELSTLGDPLADLAYNCLPWHLGAAAAAGGGLRGIPGLPALPHPLPPGVPTEEAYVAAYCAARGIPHPLQADWPFYLALALFRLAAILAGVGARAKAGNASSRIAAQMGADEGVRGLSAAALAILRGDGAGPPPPPAAPPGLGPSARVRPVLARLEKFVAERVMPAEAALNAHAASAARWTIHPLQESLKNEAQAAGLWNLWIPADMVAKLRGLVAASVDDPRAAAAILGPGLTNLEYAHCAEVMGRCVWASEVFNCSAPDTGNMEVLARYGSPAQQRRWLLPLLAGRIRSCFAMTEPAVASSDATNIRGSIQRDGTTGGYVINGDKWWISGAPDPRCAVAIFMGKTDPAAPPHAQQSMILVPMDAPGVTVVRPLPVFGFDDAPHGHAVITFAEVRVGAEALILGEGRGFEIAQGRLGPGRLHHCMRVIGMGERGVAAMVTRAVARTAFGRPLAGHQSVRLDIAHSRIELDAARLTVLEAARALDERGAKAARGAIAAAKALAPSAVLTILDRAIQVHGGAGVSDGTPLAAMWAAVRTLRLADGPDVVHLETVAKLELARQARTEAASKL